MAIEKNAKGLYATTIDGRNYEFTVWRVRPALKTLVELSRIAGPFLARGFALAKNGLQTEVSPADFQELAGLLITGMGHDVNNTCNLIEQLCTKGVNCDEHDINFESHFERDFMHMYRVVQAALEVQYGNFFEAVKGSDTTEPKQTSN